jgi:hypothetical protein
VSLLPVSLLSFSLRLHKVLRGLKQESRWACHDHEKSTVEIKWSHTVATRMRRALHAGASPRPPTHVTSMEAASR